MKEKMHKFTNLARNLSLANRVDGGAGEMCSGLSLFLIACQHLGHDGHYEGYRMAN